jgi:hypothetical protein
VPKDRRYDRRQCGVLNSGLATDAVAKRNSRRGRTRKRRPPAGEGGGNVAGQEAKLSETRASTAVKEQPPGGGGGRANRRAREQTRASTGRSGGVSDALSVGERPQSPWHPFPLSELLILAGAIGAVVAWQRGFSRHNATLLIASIVAVMLGTVEVTLREHLSGFRSHAILLSLLPPLVFHTAVILITQTQTTVPRWLNVALLPIDGALFAVLFRVLRARFQDARRERVFAARR